MISEEGILCGEGFMMNDHGFKRRFLMKNYFDVFSCSLLLTFFFLWLLRSIVQALNGMIVNHATASSLDNESN
jgi:hypothetical protein